MIASATLTRTPLFISKV